jgi:hypothetical protein
VTCVTAIAGRGFAPILSDLSVRAKAGRPAYLAIGLKVKGTTDMREQWRRLTL